MKDFLFGGENRVPDSVIPYLKVDSLEINCRNTDEIKVTWLGHSSVLISFIGEKFGPFDLTMLECGAYNEGWPYIHKMPEETAQAHLDLRGTVLLPIHWAQFNLSLHSWTEPIERLLKKAEAEKITITTPKIGESFMVNGAILKNDWWRFQE